MIRYPILPIAFFCFCLCTNAQQLVINEIDADTAGFDALEFIELYDGGTGNTPLDNHVLVFFNGAGGGSHGAYRVIDLGGLSTGADGFFLAAQVAVPGIAQRVSANTGIIYEGAIQNGEDGVGLYANTTAADISISSPKTQASDNLANLLDAVVYETNDSDSGLIAEFGLSGFSLNEHEFGNKDTDSAGRTTDGAGGLDLGAWKIYDTPTPGVRNNPVEEISVSLSAQTLSENGGSVTLTVSLDSAADGDTPLNVTLSNKSASVDTSELAVPAVVVANGQLSVDVTLSGIDDAWRDFDQVITIDISDPLNRFFPASIDVTVTDDETGSPVGTGLRLNEVYPAVGQNTDANGDGNSGASDGSDEFVELVNDSAAALDISGYTLSDFATVRHTFPAGTVLDPGCAVVVFGSGVTEGRSAPFGGALLQNANGANEFGLALNNSGDLISVKNLNGIEVAGANWGETSTSDGSLTLDPDLNANNTFTVHNVLGAPFSPGKTTTGDPFCNAPALQLWVLPASVAEDAGAGAVELTITRDGDISTPLTVNLSSSDTTEATVAATATFAGNEDEISIDIDIQDDTAQDGTQTLTITGSAPGYVDGSATLEVTDNGDAAATVYINEVDYDPVGSDAAGLEFVELYDGGGGNTPLDGFVLVFYNGNDNSPADEEYRFIDLNGQQTDASGFFVVSTPSNGIQNGGSGGDGMALYRGAAASDFNGTTPLTPPAGAVLVDALVYEIGDGILAAGLQYTGPDLTDNNNPDPGGISRVPDGTGDFKLAPLTRGASNNPAAPGAYDTWAAQFPGIGASGDDDDSDGIPNLLEFALGLDPFSFNALPAPTLNASGKIRFSITKGSEAADDPKTSYFAQASTDAISWSNADVSVITDDATTFTAEYTGNSSIALLRIGVSVVE
ncbi:MAG: lamin tail domain-containing protein [Verrucomicrobiales bacterium]